MQVNLKPYVTLLTIKGKHDYADLIVNRTTLIRNVKLYNGVPKVISSHVYEGNMDKPGSIRLFFKAEWSNGRKLNLRFKTDTFVIDAFVVPSHTLPSEFNPKVSEGFSYKHIWLVSVDTAATLDLREKVQTALNSVVFEAGRKDPEITAAIV